MRFANRAQHFTQPLTGLAAHHLALTAPLIPVVAQVAVALSAVRRRGDVGCDPSTVNVVTALEGAGRAARQNLHTSANASTDTALGLRARSRRAASAAVVVRVRRALALARVVLARRAERWHADTRFAFLGRVTSTSCEENTHSLARWI